MSTAHSTPNIALIKYWGNRDDRLRLCANGSVSMTLNTPSVNLTVKQADTFSVTSNNKQLSEKDISRFKNTLGLMEEYLEKIFNFQFSIFNSISIEIDSQIPPAIGLASSAAVFSALAVAIPGYIDADLSDKQISILARLGSGSAARSIFGGFGAIKNLEGDAIDSCIGFQVADEHHWNLHDIIIAPSTKEKKVGSSEGHPKAWTSPHFQKRVDDIEHRRQQECIDAILKKDFEKLQVVAEEDCLDMHQCMQTQNPPLMYLSDETYRIIDEITELRTTEHLPVLYTMDAGPTVHLFCTDESKDRIAKYAHEQRDCTIFETTIGQGTYLV